MYIAPNEMKWEPVKVEDVAYCPLTIGEQLRLAWAICWPCLALEVLLRPVFAYSKGKIGEHWILPLYLILGTFLLAPWVIRRVVRMDFPHFCLAVIDKDSPYFRREISYRECLSVLWLLMWRCTLVILFLELAFTAYSKLTGVSFDLGSREPFQSSFSWWAIEIARNLMLQAFVFNNAMTEKAYKRFSLVIRRARCAAGANLTPFPGTLRMIR